MTEKNSSPSGTEAPKFGTSRVGGGGGGIGGRPENLGLRQVK